MEYTVVLPAYNVEKNLPELLSALLKQTSAERILLVDDGSIDRTTEVAEDYGIGVKRFEENVGKGRAVIEGLKEVKTEAVVLIDADGQHNPEEMKTLVDGLKDCDVVIGTRFGAGIKMPVHRSLANNVVRFLVRLKARDISDPLSGFRAFKVRQFGGLKQTGFGIDLEILFTAIKKGLKIKEVPISVRYDIETKSKFNNPFTFTAISAYLSILFYSIMWLVFGRV